jgi:hypothetical protein
MLHGQIFDLQIRVDSLEALEKADFRFRCIFY